MKTKTIVRKSAPKEWEKILPVKGYPKMRHTKSGKIDWMFKALGWKKDGRRTS